MFERIRKTVSSFVSDPALELEVQRLRIANEILRSERDQARAQKESLFDFVQRMEKQRDEWRARFQEQWRQHQNAQATLEQHIYSVGTTLVRTVAMLNAELRSQGKAEVEMAAARRLATEGERVLRSSQEYGDAMRKLEATRSQRGAFGQMLGWTGDAAEVDLKSGDAPR